MPKFSADAFNKAVDHDDDVYDDDVYEDEEEEAPKKKGFFDRFKRDRKDDASDDPEDDDAIDDGDYDDDDDDFEDDLEPENGPLKKIIFGIAGVIVTFGVLGFAWNALVNTPKAMFAKRLNAYSELSDQTVNATLDAGKLSLSTSGEVVSKDGNLRVMLDKTDKTPKIDVIYHKSLYVNGGLLSTFLEDNFNYKARGLDDSFIDTKDIVQVILSKNDVKTYDKSLADFGKTYKKASKSRDTATQKTLTKILKDKDTYEHKDSMYHVTLDGKDLDLLYQAMMTDATLGKDQKELVASYVEALNLEKSDVKAKISVGDKGNDRMRLTVWSKKDKFKLVISLSGKTSSGVKAPSNVMSTKDVKKLFDDVQNNLVAQMDEDGNVPGVIDSSKDAEKAKKDDTAKKDDASKKSTDKKGNGIKTKE